jgi:thymidylate synthase ThyX
MLERVTKDPVFPVYWGKNQKGMQADEELTPAVIAEAEYAWLHARDAAVERAKDLLCLGVHKQLVNRLLEPWMWITVIVSATEWTNFFSLRCHRDAQPEIRHIAEMIADLYETSRPQELAAGEWHTPLIQPDEADLDVETRKRVAVARCARVSYLTHDGRREIAADLELFERLRNGSGKGHWSPFEHVARACAFPDRSGNFVGFTQYRKTFAEECQGAYTREKAAV